MIDTDLPQNRIENGIMERRQQLSNMLYFSFLTLFSINDVVEKPYF